MKYIIQGNIPRKSNQRQIVTNKITGKPIPIKSKKALAYCVSFELQMTKYKPYPCLEGDVKLIATIYYRTRKNDLSVELLMDLIEKVKLIKNDRQIRELQVRGKIDKVEPRVEFEINIIEGGKNEKVIFNI